MPPSIDTRKFKVRHISDVLKVVRFFKSWQALVTLIYLRSQVPTFLLKYPKDLELNSFAMNVGDCA
jgi:hypothetical protein